MDIVKYTFARILSLLRKEHGLSQKKVAEDLGVSQALLSHYEKGVRECGLDFILKIADYYNVSTDYLLGRAPERDGTIIDINDIHTDDKNIRDNFVKGSILPVLNKKLLINSLNIIYALLQDANNKTLTTNVSGYLMTSVYKIFRIIFNANDKNPPSFFSIGDTVYLGLSTASQAITETHLLALVDGEKNDNLVKLSKEQRQSLLLSSEIITQNYPLFSSSLYNLIRNTEKNILKLTDY